MPTAVPRMPASASGVSVQRSSPNSLASPSVTRKTPPRVPTSSPRTCTVGSSAIASRSARVRACAMVAGLSGDGGHRRAPPRSSRLGRSASSSARSWAACSRSWRGRLGVDMGEQVHRVEHRVLRSSARAGRAAMRLGGVARRPACRPRRAARARSAPAPAARSGRARARPRPRRRRGSGWRRRRWCGRRCGR